MRIAAAAAVLLVSGCGDDIPPGTTPFESPATVKAATGIIALVAQPEFYEAPATVSARTNATVSAKIMGEILEISVQEGDRVSAGDVLLTIDDSQLSAQRRQARAALSEAEQAAHAAGAMFDSARASMELAEKTFHRFEMLFESDSVSRQEFDEVKARYDQAAGGLSQAKSMRDAAQNRVEQARAALSAAETAYADTTVAAPYDATVTGKLVDKGDLAAPGVPLVRLEIIGAHEVHMMVPESKIHQVSLGDSVHVSIPSLGNMAVTGEIISVNSAADPATRSFQVKAGLPDLPEIRAGMFARVRIPVGKSMKIIVPETAIVRHGQLSGVYIVDAERMAHFRLIRPGRALDGQVEVLSGANVGERYVLEPGKHVVDGVTVEES